MRRMLVTATVASLTFASFAGCTSQAAPKPDPTATATICSTRNSTIEWQHGSRAASALIGVWVLTFSADQRRWNSSYHAIPVTPDWDDNAIQTTVKSLAATKAWHDALLADAARTGQVPSDFGTVATINPSDSGTAPTVPDAPSTHAMIDAVTADRYVMPFVIRCGAPHRANLAGSVTASLSGAFTYTAYSCDGAPSSETVRLALRYCP